MLLGAGNKQVFVVFKPTRFDQSPNDLMSKCLLGKIPSGGEYQVHAVFDDEEQAMKEATAVLVEAAQTVLDNYKGQLVFD